MSEEANRLLEKVLEWGADVLAGEGKDSSDALNLAHAVEELDRWLVSGKVLPQRWSRDKESLTLQQERLKLAMKSLRAAYSDDSFYGLCHEVAHCFDLDLPSADFPTINIALERLTPYERMAAEVVAHAATRAVCQEFRFPLFPDSVAYAAKSTLKFALLRAKDGEVVPWNEEDFITANRALSGSDRVHRIVLKFRVLYGKSE